MRLRKLSHRFDAETVRALDFVINEAVRPCFRACEVSSGQVTKSEPHTARFVVGAIGATSRALSVSDVISAR